MQLGYTRSCLFSHTSLTKKINVLERHVARIYKRAAFDGFKGSEYKFDSSRTLISNPLALNIILEMLQFATDDDQYTTLAAIHSMLEGVWYRELLESRCSAAFNYAISSRTIVDPEEIARNCNCMHSMPRFPCDDSTN